MRPMSSFGFGICGGSSCRSIISFKQPFYNWTRQSGANIGSVLLYLDYSAPIERIRTKAVELAARTTQPGGKLVNVQVTNTNVEAIELRVLVTAASVGDTITFALNYANS